MNKVKFMLSAIAVTAIVGGALAFKASKLPLANVYCSIDQVCTKVKFTTDNNVTQTANPCNGDYFYTTTTCPITTSFTTVDDPTPVPVRKVKAVIE